MAAGLFDVLKDLFQGEDLQRKYSDKELKNLGFSIQRIMSIKYPMQAQSQNVLGVNMTNVVKYWAFNMRGKWNHLPKWATISTAKLRKEYQEKAGEIELPEKEVRNAFMDFHGLDSHEFQFLIEKKPKEFVELMKEFEKNYNIA